MLAGVSNLSCMAVRDLLVSNGDPEWRDARVYITFAGYAEQIFDGESGSAGYEV